MTSRERVLGSLHHSEPDRVPLFAPNVMNTAEPYAPQVREFLDTFPFDRFAGVGGILHHPERKQEVAKGEFEDGYGCRFRYEGHGLPYCVHSPLSEADSVREVDAMEWFDPEAEGLIAPDADERARRLREDGQYVVNTGLPPLFHTAQYIRGFEQWLVDCYAHESLFHALTEHVFHIHKTLLLRLLAKVGPFVDLVSTGDDFGSSTAPYVSPEVFRRLIKPYYADLIASIKSLCPHVKFYLHSHGRIMDLVPDLIECGVDILNPILPLDRMDAAVLKREFGRDLCFHGGVDVEHILPFGTQDDVTRHVREVIDTLAPGGGFWFKCQVISPVIPPSHLIAAYELARDYGVYRDGGQGTAGAPSEKVEETAPASQVLHDRREEP